MDPLCWQGIIGTVLKIVDRLVLGELRAPLVFGIGVFSLLIITTVVLQEAARFVIKYSLSTGIFVKMVALASPQFIILSIPMGVLLGTLVSVGQLSSSLQITALRACGVSLWRVLVPFFLVGVFLSGVTFFGTERIIPYCLSELKKLKNEIVSGQSGGLKQERLAFPVYDGEGLRWLLIAGRVEGNQLDDVKLFYFDEVDGDNDFWVSAEGAEWTDDQWTFHNMRIVMLQPEDEPAVMNVVGAVVKQFTITPESLQLRAQTPDDLTIIQLSQVIADKLDDGLKAQDPEILDFKTKLNFKFSIPLTPLFFVFIAVPFGISRQRTSTQMGMGLALLVVLGYYVLYTACLKLGTVGAIPPILAAWIPNGLLLAVGLSTMLMRERN